MTKKKLKILYEDKYLIVIDKPSGLLTVSTEKEKERTLYHYVFEYLKQKNKNNKVFIVHRLDFDTSGLIIFAKDTKTKLLLQDKWNKVIRRYMAIVNNKLPKEEDTLKNYLKETKTNLVYVTNDSKNGNLAITSYKKVLEFDKYNLIEIEIKTGRKNQIRVQLSNIGNSILGDKKYGPKTHEQRMYLHAYYLKFNHPITNQALEFEEDIPTAFLNIINKMSN